jgi:translation initiation factor 1 (eIF-1/SUI1)
VSLLFDRIIRVTFGKPGSLLTRVQDLYIQFDAEKSLESEPNKCVIQIHNLNETSNALLQQSGVSCLLEAGYGGIAEKLFVGQIKHATVERQGRERVTKIEFQDGIEQFQTARIAQTLGPGATNQQVLQALAQEFGTGVGSIKGLEEGTFQQGITLFGPVRDKLDDITRKMGLEWSIQNNNLQILPPKVPSQTLGFLLTPDTGLIGSPTLREDSKSGGKFVEFKCLLRAAIVPGVAARRL